MSSEGSSKAPSRSQYDVLHDTLGPTSTSKAGTRYERLAALVQKTLDETADVSHDLKLIGKDTEVKHQIDVTVTRGADRRRVLIECKDYDLSGEVVGLGVIRDFYGVVDDVKPDEAIVITCNGFTRDAKKYAKGKRIKLAVLRGYTSADDEGRLLAVAITGHIKTPVDVQATFRFVDAAGLAAFAVDSPSEAGIVRESADRQSGIFLHRPSGDRVQALEEIGSFIGNADLPAEDCGNDSKQKDVSLEGCAVQRDDGPLIPIAGIIIRYRYDTHVMKFEVRAPIVALILSPVGDGTDLLVYEKDLKRFQIDADSGEVLAR